MHHPVECEQNIQFGGALDSPSSNIGLNLVPVSPRKPSAFSLSVDAFSDVLGAIGTYVGRVASPVGGRHGAGRGTSLRAQRMLARDFERRGSCGCIILC